MTPKSDQSERESENLAQIGSAWAIRLYAKEADENGKIPAADLWCVGVIVYREAPFEEGCGVVLMYAFGPVLPSMPMSPVVSAAAEPLFAHVIYAYTLLSDGLIPLPAALVNDRDRVIAPKLRTYSDVFGWRSFDLDLTSLKTCSGPTSISQEEAARCIDKNIASAQLMRRGATCAYYGGWKWHNPPRKRGDPISPLITKYSFGSVLPR